MSRFDSKRLSPFHVIEVNRHLEKLFYGGETVCNSPFIRYLIYRELEKRNVRYTRKVVTWGRQLRYSKCPDWNQPPVSLAYKHLKKGLYDPFLFKDNKYHNINRKTTGVDEKTRMKLFGREVSNVEKYGILSMIHNTQENFPVTKYPLLGKACKAVKGIYIFCTWSSRRLLYIGNADSNSPLSFLPMEIILLIEEYTLT